MSFVSQGQRTNVLQIPEHISRTPVSVKAAYSAVGFSKPSYIWSLDNLTMSSESPFQFQRHELKEF